MEGYEGEDKVREETKRKKKGGRKKKIGESKKKEERQREKRGVREIRGGGKEENIRKQWAGGEMRKGREGKRRVR